MSIESKQPIVCVVTPVYNMARYLAECIESVLAQTYENFEYLIIDNASNDDSLEIARRYAASDSRIRVLAFDDHMPQIQNYNRALQQIGPGFKYCKFAQADDTLLPECVGRMVDVADTDPEIRFVSAYTILQNRVFLDGLDYSETIIDGKEICRRYLHDQPYLFGSQTTCLYLMDDIYGNKEFFPEISPFADTDAAFRVTMAGKFGFVHQVLSFVRLRPDSITEQRTHYELDALTRRVMYEKYGRDVLSDGEFEAAGKRLRWRIRRVLGKGLFGFYGRDFWDFHREALGSAGASYSAFDVFLGAVVVFMRSFFNLEALFRRRR